MWMKTRHVRGGWEGLLSTLDDDPISERWRLRWSDKGVIRWEGKNESLWSNWMTTEKYKVHENTENIVALVWICIFVHCRFVVSTTTGHHAVSLEKILHEWLHIALVLYGPNDGISVYLNGCHVYSDLSVSSMSLGHTSGNVILGRDKANRSGGHGDLSVDELYFWNQDLGAAVIKALYDSYWIK